MRSTFLSIAFLSFCPLFLEISFEIKCCEGKDLVEVDEAKLLNRFPDLANGDDSS